MTYLVNNAMLCAFVYKYGTFDTEQLHGYRNKIMDLIYFQKLWRRFSGCGTLTYCYINIYLQLNHLQFRSVQ
jgi:hypothetical protein